MATNSARPVLDVPYRPMTAADPAALPTYLPSGDFDYELDNGRLVILDPADMMHGAVHANLIAALIAQAANQGRVLSGVGVIIRKQPDCVYGPDIVFIPKSSLPARTSAEDYLETIPELIGEVRSVRDSLPYLERKARGLSLRWSATRLARGTANGDDHSPPSGIDAASAHQERHSHRRRCYSRLFVSRRQYFQRQRLVRVMT